uniref:T9SS sorting signal type C domain-containing protein n=1 Tax=Flavobacterium sp. TaxID=239 RepID=UPI00404AD158
MKKFTTLLIIFIISFGYAQENKSLKDNFKLLENFTETKILYNRVAPVSDAINLRNEGMETLYFMQVYHEMQRADFLERLPKLEVLENEEQRGIAKRFVPLSVLISEFESIKPEIKTNNLLGLNSNGLYEITDNSIDYFDKYSIGIITPLVNKIKGTNVSFVLDADFIFNTTQKSISKIEANFNNEQGWIRVVENKPIAVNYNSVGKKLINFKITLSNGEIFTQSSTITIQERAVPLDRDATISLRSPSSVSPLTSITSSLTYQGVAETSAHAGVGEFQIYYDHEAGLLDKPIIILDGFDPADGRDVSSIYSLLNYGSPVQNLGETVRNQGFDVVVLNFPIYTRPDGITNVDGGVDYIQRNARVLIELINYINANKVGNQELVIIGPSMGGLISRMALRYMEMNGMDAQTRLWLSFDSPHLGANVPIGMQHMFNYLAYDSDVSDLTVRAIVDSMLKSPAARQMLLDHFEGHLQNGSLTDFNTSNASLLPTGHPTFRNIFQNELNTIGFPQKCRNIAISNGANNGSMTGTPGMTVLSGLDVPDSSGFTRALLDLNFTPAANGNSRVSRVQKQIWTGWWWSIGTGQTNARSFSYTAGLDSAPGGMFDIASLAASAGSNPTLTRFLNAMTIKRFDFIPAQSSLGITATNNWYSNITTSTTTAFDAFYIPNASEFHVTLTSDNVVFAYDEITNPQLKCPSITTWNGTSWNNGLPARDKQVVFSGNYTSSSDIEACSISVTGTAIVNFQTEHDLTVRGAITVGSTAQLSMSDNANIYQIEELPNIGNVEINKQIALKRQDYVGWSSPVANQNLLNFSPSTLVNKFYEYVPTGTSTPTIYNSVDPISTNFSAGKGYLICAENTMPSTSTAWNGTFIGTPFNGRTNKNIINGGVGLGYNLIGNPYPSPLNIQEFINGNVNTIDGTLHFWTNTNAPSGGVYTINNFASRNLTGGTAAVNGALVPDVFVQTGQGFYVNSSVTGPMYFTNSMRNKVSNNQFMNRNASTTSLVVEEKHRFWLNLSEVDKNHNQILIGYTENATNAEDFGYDGKLFNNGSSSIYSLLNDEAFVIQAKGLPFLDEDIVPLGFTTQNTGTFIISLGDVDGLFAASQNIYLKDNYIGTIHNLNDGNYTFVSNTGLFNDRFEIIYRNTSLSIEENIFNENTVILYEEQNVLNINSVATKISAISVYDVLGRVLYTENNILKNTIQLLKLKKTNGILLIQLSDENQKVIQKKIIF